MNDPQQVTLTNAGPVPIQSSQPQQSVNPVMDSMSSALKQQQEAVDKAAASLKETPQYISGSSTQPAMPVQKATPFAHSSVNNLNNIQPQTRAGARAKGIGQIAAQAGNFVGTYFKQKQAEKTQALAQDISRTFELQKGMDEAKQILAQDPNNQQAKMQLQKNESQLKAVLSGKNGKEIAKAFDVTFGEKAQQDEKKKKNDPAAQAVTAAMKQHQEEERLTKFEDQQPQRMSPNQAYAQKQAELVQQQKQLETMLKVYGPMQTAVMKEEGANNRATNANQVREDGFKAANQRTADEIKAREQNIRIEHENRSAEINSRHSARMSEIKQEKNLGSQFEIAKIEYAEASKDLESAQKRVQEINKEISTIKDSDNDSTSAQRRADLKAELKALTDNSKGKSYIDRLVDNKIDAQAYLEKNPDAAAAKKILNDMDKK